MPGLNKVMLIGHLGRDPETRWFEGGKAMCKLSLATSETYQDDEGQAHQRTSKAVCGPAPGKTRKASNTAPQKSSRTAWTCWADPILPKRTLNPQRAGRMARPRPLNPWGAPPYLSEA